MEVIFVDFYHDHFGVILIAFIPWPSTGLLAMENEDKKPAKLSKIPILFHTRKAFFAFFNKKKVFLWQKRSKPY
jgi:hypothetical protein